mgnify:CR=1 FL=1
MAHQKHDKKVLRANDWKKYTLQVLRNRGRKRKLDVTIQEKDLQQPNYCPVLGIPLVYNNKIKFCDNSASVDRIDNTKGYIPGNVHVISFKANRLKSNATSEELMKVATYFSNRE